ncbi:DUF4185 domain-containing protein [Speluncibacter jeojiensis]|uniref:DUF4185 domain-containing protein n=1 Tax=Speluncibacter jeojiensis TaxID=2710754 RepID=A0A9X4RDX2_9ACTN|nr:DUF4185 domain-containing protein [Corynebacteriales bacterium D3-21]
MPRPRTRLLTSLATTALSLATLAAVAPATLAPAATAGILPCRSSDGPGTGSLGSTGLTGSVGGTGSIGGTGSSQGSSFGSTNPIPWLNGRDGGLPNLKGETQAVQHITGLDSPNDTAFRFNVVGTDLGIMWDNGGGQVLTAFGDTVGFSWNPLCQGLLGDWRSNVLLRSSDRDLSRGMRIDSAALDRRNHAKEIIPSKKINGVEMTTIPTAGIEVGGVQYINYMSVRSWGLPGAWITNFSALASSTDNGENWTVLPTTARTNDPVTGNHNFQMAAYVKSDGYVYAFGTPSGRDGAAYLSRVREADFTDQLAYEYWNGTGWTPTLPAAAVPVMASPVSEMSVAYNDYLHKFVTLYTDATSSVVMRTADRPQGPWSTPKVLISGRSVPGLYGAYIHPWSSGPDLYYVATTWSDYNVMLMRTRLA